MATGNSRLFYALPSANPIHLRMSAFTLFQRDDCHLCDQALEVLASVRFPDFSSVFIDDDEALEARYGARVPVLRRSDGVEIDWPFDPAALQSMLL
ncbi:hypothetical protein GCM10009552_01080 [Rothia nasimurium]